MRQSILAGNCQNQVLLGYQAISALEVKVFKVQHMGFSNILTLAFYICLLSITFPRYFEITKQEQSYNPKCGLNFVCITF
jgi:hypothetical protein